VRETEDKNRYLLKLVQKLPGTGIIYVRSRKKSRELALFLSGHKISCDYYHAGLTHPVRSRKQYEWMTGRIRIITATNAFGMGIDKPDVRFVIHFDLPSSLEEYFQEAGRAGRDNKQADAILLYHEADRSGSARRIDMNFPELDIIKNIYRALGNYYQIPVGGGKSQVFDFNIAEFASRYDFSIITIYNSLKILQLEGYIELTEEIYNPSKVKFISNRDDLYRFQVANADFDAFIKLLLRTYTGIFTEFVTVYEDSLAGKANVKVDVIVDYLNRLNNMGIIRYLKQKKTPVLIYTEERLDIKDLRISKETYKDRKERFVNRLNHVLDYATGHTKCRSIYLLEYFGEKNANRCGHCDICLRRNELDLSKYEFDLVLDEVKELLQHEKLPLGKLVDSIPLPEKKVIRVIRWLLDNDKIVEKNNLLCWNIRDP